MTQDGTVTVGTGRADLTTSYVHKSEQALILETPAYLNSLKCDAETGAHMAGKSGSNGYVLMLAIIASL